jgi:lactobin A/cerein 7B family class IIb bacteriocin
MWESSLNLNVLIMKANNKFEGFFEEISPSELESVKGGVVPPPLAIAGVVVGVIGGICAISYYVGYQVGKLTAEGK